MGGYLINELSLSQMMDDFRALTDIRISFYRVDGTNCRICTDKGPSQFCSKLREKPELSKRCQCSDLDAVYQARRTRAPYRYLCYAGIEEVVYPMICEGHLLGVFMIGQIRLDYKTLRDDQIHFLQKFGFDVSEMQKLYKRLPCISRPQLEAAIRMVEVISHYSYLNGLVRSYSPPLIARITDYIESHLNQPLKLDEISQALHISKSTLCHAVQREMDTSVIQLINQKRITVVCDALKSGKTISDAAAMAGFSSASYCSNCFKKMMGMYPDAYRKSLNERGATPLLNVDPQTEEG